MFLYLDRYSVIWFWSKGIVGKSSIFFQIFITETENFQLVRTKSHNLFIINKCKYEIFRYIIVVRMRVSQMFQTLSWWPGSIDWTRPCGNFLKEKQRNISIHCTNQWIGSNVWSFACSEVCWQLLSTDCVVNYRWGRVQHNNPYQNNKH
jgi:hypothetical protein